MLENCRNNQNRNRPETNPGLPNTDLIIFLFASPCEGTTLAYASFCTQDEDTDRPDSGYINVCTNNYQVEYILRSTDVFIHEIMHVVGFSLYIFGYYRDANGKLTTDRDKHGQPLKYGNVYFSQKVAKRYTVNRSSIKLNYTKQIWGFRLPTLLAIAAKHFGCPNLEYFPIEDNGEERYGMSSHFDDLVGGTEMMTPIMTPGTSELSKLTLAVLEDTGWYLPDYSKAAEYKFGKNLGCDFLTNGCYNYMISNPKNMMPYCNTYRGYALRCSSNALYVNVCNLRKFPKLDPKHQYLLKINGFKAADGSPQEFAGKNVYKEFCPTFEPASFPDKSNLLCTHTENQNKDAKREKFLVNYFGSDSLCFSTTSEQYQFVSWFSSWTGRYGAGCFRYICNRNTSTIIVTSRGRLAAKCKDKGDIQYFNNGLVKGYIECRAYNETCTSEKNFEPYEYKTANVAIINFYVMVSSIIWLTRLF